MPADEIVGSTVLVLACEFLGYWIARLVFPVVSFGWIRVERVFEDFGMPNWHGFHRRPRGGWVVSGTPASMYGLLILALLMALALTAYIRS